MTRTIANPNADRLRALLSEGGQIKMPCCFDALSAKLIERAGFDLTFLSGFGASAARLAAPDTGLMSYGEVLDQARNAMQPISIPMIADGDSGQPPDLSATKLKRLDPLPLLWDDQNANLG